MSARLFLFWLVSIGFVGAGLIFLRWSYQAHTRWWECVRLGDHSAAEVYEVEFWPQAVLGIGFILTGAFLARRKSARRQPRSAGDPQARRSM